VIGAAGTRNFEPDGVAFCYLACLARPCQPASVGAHPLPVCASLNGASQRSAAYLCFCGTTITTVDEQIRSAHRGVGA